MKAFHGIAVAIPDRAAVAQRELIERRVGGDLDDLGGCGPTRHTLKCMGRSADRLICQSLPGPIGDPRGVKSAGQRIPGAVCSHLGALVSHGDGWIGCKFRIYAEAVRVHRCVNPGRRVVARNLPRLGKFPQDNEVAQRARSGLALKSLLGESGHADKVALARKVFTSRLAGLVHGIAARQHGDDAARAHGGHRPLDHIVMEWDSIDFDCIRIGDVADSGIKRTIGDLTFSDIRRDDRVVRAQHARETCAHGVDLHAGDVHIHAIWNAAHEVARTAARLQDLCRALIADTGAPQRLPD